MTRRAQIVTLALVGSPEDIAAGGYVAYIEHCKIMKRIEAERDAALAKVAALMSRPAHR